MAALLVRPIYLIEMIMVMVMAERKQKQAPALAAVYPDILFYFFIYFLFMITYPLTSIY